MEDPEQSSEPRTNPEEEKPKVGKYPPLPRGYIYCADAGGLGCVFLVAMLVAVTFHFARGNLTTSISSTFRVLVEELEKVNAWTEEEARSGERRYR